jgi:hypothetical protein
MTGIVNAMARLVEAEIKEHHAAIVRQMVAVGIIMCLLLIWLAVRQ